MERHEHKRLQEEDHEPTTNSVFQRRSSQSWTKARTGSSPTPRLILRGSGSAFQASLTPGGERQSKGRRRFDQLQEDVGVRRLGRSDAPRMGSGGPAWTLAQKEDARRTRAGEDCAGLWRRLASMVCRNGWRWGGKEVRGRKATLRREGRTRRSRPEKKTCRCTFLFSPDSKLRLRAVTWRSYWRREDRSEHHHPQDWTRTHLLLLTTTLQFTPSSSFKLQLASGPLPALSDSAPTQTTSTPAPAHMTASKSKEPTGILSIAILKCDQLHPDSQPLKGTYEDVLHNLFEPILGSAAPHLTLKTTAYDVVDKREYPSEKELEGVDCVLITGSFEAESVGDDEPWILRLAGFLIQVNDSFPRIRMIVSSPSHLALIKLRRTYSSLASFRASALDCRCWHGHSVLVELRRTLKDGGSPFRFPTDNAPIS